ncbi:hypothetical protein A4R43_33580 [Amycolatopsis albispora]|uniref:Uncharacterized protein n=1 Tax=Amycolatopsis albispora TaxID=1804986 RepID=A0A344LFE2_9PSEU|nr:hypothetical protein A4R43_33580 [Amycolatopsis albispora]
MLGGEPLLLARLRQGRLVARLGQGWLLGGLRKWRLLGQLGALLRQLGALLRLLGFLRFGELEELLELLELLELAQLLRVGRRLGGRFRPAGRFDLGPGVLFSTLVRHVTHDAGPPPPRLPATLLLRAKAGP